VNWDAARRVAGAATATLLQTSCSSLGAALFALPRRAGDDGGVVRVSRREDMTSMRRSRADMRCFRVTVSRGPPCGQEASHCGHCLTYIALCLPYLLVLPASTMFMRLSALVNICGNWAGLVSSFLALCGNL